MKKIKVRRIENVKARKNRTNIAQGMNIKTLPKMGRPLRGCQMIVILRRQSEIS